MLAFGCILVFVLGVFVGFGACKIIFLAKKPDGILNVTEDVVELDLRINQDELYEKDYIVLDVKS